MEAVKADHTDSLNQLQNEYKIVLDAVQSEKQEVSELESTVLINFP